MWSRWQTHPDKVYTLRRQSWLTWPHLNRGKLTEMARMPPVAASVLLLYTFETPWWLSLQRAKARVLNTASRLASPRPEEVYITVCVSQWLLTNKSHSKSMSLKLIKWFFFLLYYITIFYLFVIYAFTNYFWNSHIFMVETLTGPAVTVDELNAFTFFFQQFHSST